MKRVAALYVEQGGIYCGVPYVDAWTVAQDARKYAGPWPVVAHPPCKRWGKYWDGRPRHSGKFKLGDDDGCFAAALFAVRTYGGILEHPASSHAWKWFGLQRPEPYEGWTRADEFGGWTCYVEQGHYGHMSRKPTWLYACRIKLPNLIWRRSKQRIHPVALAKHGYERARKIGMMAMVGGTDKERIRDATTRKFRNILIEAARHCQARKSGL